MEEYTIHRMRAGLQRYIGHSSKEAVFRCFECGHKELALLYPRDRDTLPPGWEWIWAADDACSWATCAQCLHKTMFRLILARREGVQR
jgi:hypothetical protein